MTWVLVIGAGWLLLAALSAVVIGRSIRLADARATQEIADEPNFVVDPASAPRGIPTATPPHSTAPTEESQPAPPPRDTPTIPGIPAARPPAPGAGRSGGQHDQIRRTGLA